MGENIKDCNCGRCNWSWVLDDNLRSWIKCKECGVNMFDEGVGVILINWDLTNIDHINIKDVLISNKYNKGVVTND